MNIKFNFTDNKGNPTDEVKAFIEYLLNNAEIKSEEVMVDSPENLLGKGADYFVQDNGLLLETTYLIDQKDLARSAKWSITVNVLSKLIKKHKKFSEIKGLYSITTAEDFGLKAAQLKNESLLNTKISAAVDIIVQAIISDKTEEEILGYKVKIEKVNEIDNGVYFSTIGTGKFLDIAGTFHENLKNKFEKANFQLDIKLINEQPVQKRILLIVNKYKLLTFDWDLYDGISYSYDDLIKKYKNIDEIWFLVEGKENDNSYKLLYKKSVFEQFENMDFTNLNQQDYEVFAKWFSSLEKLNDKKKQELIEALRVLLKDKRPYEIFPDSQTRIEMVRYGRWLAENNKRDDANWLTKKFLDDPDPADPPNDNIDKFGYKLHKSIEDAVKPDMHTIHTVKGHLAWTVQILALKKDYLKESYSYTQEVLRNTKNFYLVLEWLFPLIEISNRRIWLKEIESELYEDFKKLCFELLDKYSNYPDLAKSLVHVFYYFKELTTLESKNVIDKLSHAEGYDSLLVYFALFRANLFKSEEYSEDVRNYNPKYAVDKLNSIISSSDEKDKIVRSGIVWNIWKILKENDKEFDNLSKIIDMFLEAAYDNGLYRNFEKIVEEHIDKHFDKCSIWFEKIITTSDNYLISKPLEGNNMWLSSNIGEVLHKIAKRKPNVIKDLIEKLYDMWMKGAYIGDISEIFTSYSEIKDAKLRKEIKKDSKRLYSEMKAVNSKLQKIEWV